MEIHGHNKLKQTLNAWAWLWRIRYREPIRGHLRLVRKHVAARTVASDRTARQLDIADKGHRNLDIFNVCTVNPQIYFKSGYGVFQPIRYWSNLGVAVRMGLLERCQELFKTSNLYEVLAINKEATEADIRRSYYKVSLKVHPDRAPDDPLATEKFQVNALCCEVTDSAINTR